MLTETIHLMGGPANGQSHQHSGGHAFCLAYMPEMPLVYDPRAGNEPVEVTFQTLVYHRHHGSMFSYVPN